MDDDVAALHPYGAVLERMIELCVGSKATFGAALQQATRELGVAVEPGSDIERALLLSAFQIVGSGKLPGCPEA